MVIRPARLGDFDTCGKTVRGLVAEIDGRVIAYVGYHVTGTFAHVFSWVGPEMNKITIARAARRFLDGIRLPQSCAAQGPESERFLEWLGFRFAGECAGERYFVRGVDV